MKYECQLCIVIAIIARLTFRIALQQQQLFNLQFRVVDFKSKPQPRGTFRNLPPAACHWRCVAALDGRAAFACLPPFARSAFPFPSLPLTNFRPGLSLWLGDAPPAPSSAAPHGVLSSQLIHVYICVCVIRSQYVFLCVCVSVWLAAFPFPSDICLSLLVWGLHWVWSAWSVGALVCWSGA